MSDQLLVIGGGPAGIEAAREAARLGLAAILVSDGPIGGRAGWHSLLPSKVWLAAAEAEQHARAVDAVHPADASSIVARVTQVKESWNAQSQRELEALDVMILTGVASFDEAGVTVRNGDGQTIATFAEIPVVVAAGSVPVFPEALKPDGKRVLAPRFLSHLNDLPQTMLVIGAGPTGCEAAYLFNALEVEVTWIVDQFGILPLFHPDAGEALGEALAQQGVRIVRGQMAERLERAEDGVTAVLSDGSHYAAEKAFVAIGRRPDWMRLDLTAAGLRPDGNGTIAVDGFGRTQNPAVFLVGDAAGGPMIANKAMDQARAAVRCIAEAAVQPFDPGLVAQVTYTEPQVAQVGDVTTDESVRVPFKESLKAHILPEGDGYLELFYDTENGRVRGAVAVGPHAADVVAPVLVALKLGGCVADLAALYGGHPSLSELPFIAARQAGQRP